MSKTKTENKQWWLKRGNFEHCKIIAHCQVVHIIAPLIDMTQEEICIYIWTHILKDVKSHSKVELEEISIKKFKLFFVFFKIQQKYNIEFWGILIFGSI